MRQQDILNQSVRNLYTMRDEVCLEMVEATGKQLNTLKTKLQMIEDAIFVKESDDGQEEIY